MFSNSALTVGMHVPVKIMFPFHFQWQCGSAAATEVWLKRLAQLFVAARVMLHLLYTAFNNLRKHEHSKLQDISQWVQLC